MLLHVASEHLRLRAVGESQRGGLGDGSMVPRPVLSSSTVNPRHRDGARAPPCLGLSAIGSLFTFAPQGCWLLYPCRGNWHEECGGLPGVDD
eukprot:710558-Rhodomonas_salina.2